MSAFNWDDQSEFFDSNWTTAAIYNTNTYYGIIYNKQLSNSIVNAGLSSDVMFSMMFQVSDFVTIPSVDELLTVNSEELRIKTVRKDSTNKTFILDLVEKYG